ncbi:amino acid/polyamine/organocation transporter, APC superfamily [Mucilaginibacter sp. OK268]|uniref:APC family permease n=1 Tax=Mucilaginibacter sp. OK268 TaxID=1881048 RepID=UPI0008882361|nr:amino acid permease [Mucilaginibacter sp. OK268]SDP56139.1 amino acid/polyamine/organocation transporter, APC superfamily [Mucilaginibacter sp. OK268]
MSITPKLTRFDLSMIVISLVIGMGIFATPGEVAISSSNPFLYFGAWFFGGAVSLCGALTFAEIGARYPTTGGFYKVFSYCFHPAFAFMINWILVISNAASVAAVALIGAEYINPVIMPTSLQNDLGIKIMTITSVLILYIINFLGIKMSARTQNVLTIFKISMILILCTAVFKSHITPGDYKVIVPPDDNKYNLSAFGISLVAVFFTYGGYQQTINFGGDIINAKTNIPKAIFTGMITVIFLYLLINFAYYSVLGIKGLQHKTALAATLAGAIFGAVGYKIISLLMFVSVLAFINVNIMANPRVYYAMAEDGILPRRFKHVNQQTQVQEFGLSFFVTAVLLILFFISSFQKILSYVMFFDTIGLSTAAVTIFILRKKTKHLDKTGIYTMKWYPVIPIIFIVAYWFVTISIFIENPLAALICLGAFVTGLIIYFITKNSQKTIIIP